MNADAENRDMVNGENLPVLSICIPTFNRCELLERCLATVVPQVAQTCGSVELVVSDNASEDQTPAVIAQFREVYPFLCHRNESNVGPLKNICECIRRAHGDFIWVIGDDDMINIGGLNPVCKTVIDHGTNVDLITVNYYTLPFAQLPAASVVNGGVPPMGASVVRTLLDNGYHLFQDLFDGEGGAYTPLYTLIIRRTLWSLFFKERVVGSTYSNARTTYPHAWMLGSVMVGKPVYYIATPILTLFSKFNADTWAGYAPLVVTLRRAELLRHFERSGVSRIKLAREYDAVMICTRKFLWHIVGNRQYAGSIIDFLRLLYLMPHHRKQLRSLMVRESLSGSGPAWLRIVLYLLLPVWNAVCFLPRQLGTVKASSAFRWRRKRLL